MRRAIALALASLLFLSVTAMWIHSHVAPYIAMYHRVGVVFLRIHEDRGWLFLGVNESSYVENGVRTEWGNPAGWEYAEQSGSSSGALDGWSLRLNPLGGPTTSSRGFSVVVPFWFLFLLSTGLFLLAHRRWMKSRRPPGPHCKSCGYNLTGNVSGVCPECGTAMAAQALIPREDRPSPIASIPREKLT